MTEEESSNTPLQEDPDEEGLEALLDYLQRSRAFDFTGYKRTTLGRRVRRRMQMVGVATFGEYVDYLEVHPDEFQQLFDMILINVTGFFRDPSAWAALAPRLGRVVEARAPDGPIRVWSAGCASGEEAYTLAILLAEHLGTEAFLRRVKIYATDLDDGALQQARVGTYGAKSIEAVPPELAAKYLTPLGTSFTFSKELRRALVFGRHDLVQDAPISRVDILACRNTLMYFNSEAQARILSRLHFALAERGLLLLGKAEMLLTHAGLFSAVDLKERIFERAPKRGGARDKAASDGHANGAEPTEDERHRVFEVAFETSPVAQILVDPAGRLALVNRRASHMFGVRATDVGRPFQDLELSYRPAELRSCIDTVRKDRRAMRLREVERPLPDGEKCFLDIELQPLISETGAVLGTQVSFTDVTIDQRLHQDLRKATSDLEVAHADLQSTSEELETTNEELQSTVEELETTNEELQSTNEELETINEELQSTNEELQTMNSELRVRGTELNDLNDFLTAILSSLSAGVVVLDRNLTIRAWNPRMEDLWGLRSDEVRGKPLPTLDIGLPTEALMPAIRAALADGNGAQERTVEATNRRGRAIRCKVTVTSLRSENAGVILVINEVS